MSPATIAPESTIPMTPEEPAAAVSGHVLALHCSGAGGHQWKSWRSLASDRLEIVAPPLLGYESTLEWDMEQRLDLEAEARAIAPVLAECGDGVHLVGHSYGGAVAIELALRHPDRIRSLTLYEPVRFALLREYGDAEWFEIGSVARQIVKLALTGSLEEPSKFFVDYWSGPGTWARLPPAVRKATRLRLTKVCAEFDALFSDVRPLADYGRLGMPVHLLCGTESPAPALRVVDRLAQLWPGARRTRLVGLGHMGPVQDPARVMAAAGMTGNADHERA